MRLLTTRCCLLEGLVVYLLENTSSYLKEAPTVVMRELSLDGTHTLVIT